MNQVIETLGAVMAHWKGFRSVEEAHTYLQQLAHYHGDRQILLALPLHHLNELKGELIAPSLTLGVTSMADVREGSFTKEIAADLLVETGARFVLLGDRDARRRLEEEDDSLRAKVTECLHSGLNPYLCVGESLEEYHAGRTNDILCKQLEEVLGDLESDQQGKVGVIYESCWSLRFVAGATDEALQRAQQQIRDACVNALGNEGKQQSCFIALPPYMTALDQLPAGSEREGYYLSKAAVLPEVLSTAAPREQYQPTEETMAYIEKARTTAQSATPSLMPAVPEIKKAPPLAVPATPAPSVAEDRPVQRKLPTRQVENLTDLLGKVQK